MNIPAWFNDKPDVWANQAYRVHLEHIEKHILSLGFKIESAHPGWVKEDKYLMYFNMLSKINMPKFYDELRIYVILLADIRKNRWEIQIPAQGRGRAYKLYAGEEDIGANELKSCLQKTLIKYKPYKIKTTKEKKVEKKEINFGNQINMFG